MSLDLERDLLLTEEDLAYMARTRLQKEDKIDLGVYLDFLEEIGAFDTNKTEFTVYPSDFEL
ncbi:MAG: hypothetical protein C4576_26865 [Desulfobacteraceae bacterium]|nr:MAG: hypothetical protein C4576_26865 [Desulfobacteraceae bacterium]